MKERYGQFSPPETAAVGEKKEEMSTLTLGALTAVMLVGMWLVVTVHDDTHRSRR